MKLTIYLFLLSSLAVHFNTNAEPKSMLSSDLPAYSQIYDDTRDPFKDARNALALAKETNRQVLIEIGGNWCTWCHKMDDFLAKNPDIFQALHANYVLLKINVSDSNENEAFMSALPPVLGYPHMYVSTATGKMILSKDTAELLTGSEYSREQWLTFIDKWSLTQWLASSENNLPATKGNTSNNQQKTED
ncbi:thioredoxin family protein [Litorilituus lipolyticus]|uniref:Thioredoxin family protein n=1 Tax=Litorilituus lipolyticus TaxID=2491017 RepID=A0A502L054_9GAMM|nr:thioredoxin family protein [Litorilituus lipolyticus]TPH15641.1 thioredoxin family protein [Litorilituus lipolyticus]